MQPMVAFDLETTGVDVETDRIVEATVAAIHAAERYAKATTLLIAVEVDIPVEAARIHGINTEHARAHGAPTVQVLQAVAEQLELAMASGQPVVGCNLAYDFTLLDRELRRHQLPTLQDRLGGAIRPVVDVYVLDKQLDMWRKGGRKLGDLCAEYGVPQKAAHTSADDAMNSARIAFQMMQRAALAAADRSNFVLRHYPNHRRPQPIWQAYTGLATMSLDQLHDAQVDWRKEQQLSLKDHFRGKGKTVDDIRTAWPLVPYKAQEAMA